MSDNISIRWLGHSCFKLSCGDHTAVVDPYKEVTGYPKLKTSAGSAYKTHDHDDHGYLKAVKIIKEKGDSPFKVSTVKAFHDDKGGKLRGETDIIIFEANGKKIVHLGDLGHLLNAKQLSAVKGCDVLLLPVGGFYTIDAGQAAETMKAVDPKITIPMHYRKNGRGYDVLAEPEEFLKHAGDRNVIISESDTYTVGDAPDGSIVVLAFKG